MRRRRPEKRSINPDPKFNDLQVSKFMNYLLVGGKKGIAEKILYDAFDIVKEKSSKDPVDVFKKALNNAAPHVEVKSKRIGGATYQVPIEVPNRRQFYLAAHWIIDSAKKRSGSPMSNRLAGELISASNNEGSAIKKKEDTHRMAEANKAFAHFGRGR
ncbi:MAG TPA: 30S ribosomal protein S7 [Candidatus Marinimicrobia bacterium]|jgi:small subunit ribosomal protein S7|nr:30S ribosomal protein S7 [Candidatus Neomarinimicrobiota bacterium]HJO21449.1 30S ribosomal protein S7 [Candidatus Neomarinimicrobiota bacterium]|tara:strand:+ start:2052 stop:2525 length:474 start_codon:yes stop_codon:yes gene_type:complete